MHYSTERLPDGAKKAGATPQMNEKSVPEAILKKHMTPKDRCGLVVVKSGKLRFQWEDTGELFDVDPEHPMLIHPERYHKVILAGPASFHVEFYHIPSTAKHDPKAKRPCEGCCRK